MKFLVWQSEFTPLQMTRSFFRKDPHIFHYKKVQSDPSTPQQMSELWFLLQRERVSIIAKYEISLKIAFYDLSLKFM